MNCKLERIEKLSPSNKFLLLFYHEFRKFKKNKMKKTVFITAFIFIIACFSACYQPDPPVINLEQKGDFAFSGYQWKIKSSATGTTVGPGPNIFSASSNNVWLDANNMLHLKITKTGSEWHCSEVVSTKEFGMEVLKALLTRL